MTKTDGWGRVRGVEIPDAVFLKMVEVTRRDARARRELVDPNVDAAAHLVAAAGGSTRPKATDLADGVDGAGAPPDAVPHEVHPAPTPAPESELMTYAQAATALCRARRTVRQMASDGRLVKVGEGRGARVTRASVEAFIASGGAA